MKLVIIDDNLVNVAVFRMLARQLSDVETVEFTDPVAALAWCRSNESDLLVVDYMMPKLDGLAFLHEFRKIPGCRNVPVLMITASHEIELRHDALNQGANDFLTKPVDRVEFLARARNMLALRRGQKALDERANWLAAEVSGTSAEMAKCEHDAIFCLSRAAEYRDVGGAAHVSRVAEYARLIGDSVGLAQFESDRLFEAAPLHDIGNIAVPDHLLSKPGPLTDQERTTLSEHARIGHDILRGSSSPILQMAAVIARSHHEKFDGTGYPSGQAGEDIPLVGRIVAVADVFDALTSPRPFRAAWAPLEARAYLEAQSGKHFDPQCVDAVLNGWEAVLHIHGQAPDDPNTPLAQVAASTSQHAKESA